MSSRVQEVASFFLTDFFGSLIRFPLWWYTDGLVSIARWRLRVLQYHARGYAIGRWLRHFFVPMYGAYDWTGRLISIMMRAVIILARLIALVVEGVAALALIFVWCVAPIVSVVFLLLNISASIQGWVLGF